MKLLHSLKFRFIVFFSVFIVALSAITAILGIQQMSKAVSDTFAARSKDIITESRNLEKATVEISNGMNEMAHGTGQINSAVNQVEEISKTNKDSIDALFAEVSKFKVD